MKKVNAIYLNKKLGVKIFDESRLDILKLIKYSKKEIKDLCVDDLIIDGKWSKRLINIVNEIKTSEV